jgi:hypothetical protein
MLMVLKLGPRFCYLLLLFLEKDGGKMLFGDKVLSRLYEDRKGNSGESWDKGVVVG